jgi:hypothetical protein
MADHLIALFSLAWLLWVALAAVGLILERRSPAATLAWLLALLFMPYFGYLIYLLFGPRRLRRRRLRYGRARDRLIQSTHRLRQDRAELPGFPSTGLERQLATLLERIAQGAPAPATEVTVLETGDDCFQTIEAALEAATHHVHLEYYMWQPDRIGTRLRDRLVDKARAGVQVRLLLDAIGSDRTSNRFLQPLREAGGMIAWFNPISLRRLRPNHINFRSHRKIVVCDGRTGFTGGINRDREKPHGSPLPHHRADGSRTRRFGRLSRPVESPSAEAAQGFSARKPEPHLYPLQAHVHPVGCSHGLHWTTITPLFQVPLGTPFGPSVGSLAPRRRLPYYALC